MYKKHVSWYSSVMGREMNMMQYGENGIPIIAFPTDQGSFDEWENHGMINALSYQLEGGYNCLFNLQTMDYDSLLNMEIEPEERLNRYLKYQKFIFDELLPYIKKVSSDNFIIMSGVGFGAYHAANLVFKYPNRFGKLIGMDGLYEVTPYLGGFYNDTVYYNSPLHFIPQLDDSEILKNYERLDIRLVTSNINPNFEDHTERFSNMLRERMIDHIFDQKDPDLDGDLDQWDYWKLVMRRHLV